VLREASAVVSLQNLRDTGTLVLPHGSRCHNVDIITNGFDRDDFERYPARAVVAKPTVSIAYTGVWKEGYGPAMLYRAVASLLADRPEEIANLRVITAGFEPGEAARFGISPYVCELGRVPHASAVGLMKGADALFLPCATGLRADFHFPGKTYEYLASKRPILAIAKRTGALAALLGSTGGAVIAEPGDDTELERRLVELCRHGTLAVPPLQEAELERYERRSLTGELAAVLDRVTLQQSSALASPSRVSR
jgi:glycosyltransferase involved in cell wall biosynthesis